MLVVVPVVSVEFATSVGLMVHETLLAYGSTFHTGNQLPTASSTGAANVGVIAFEAAEAAEVPTSFVALILLVQDNPL